MDKFLFLLVGGVFAYCISTIAGATIGTVLRSLGASDLPWAQIQFAGAKDRHFRKVQSFLSEIKHGSSSEEIERKLKMNKTEVQTLIRVLKENHKVKV